MKKAIASLFALIASVAICAPSYMASQTWVTNRINRLVFDSDRFGRIERAFTRYLPSLEEAWTFDDSSGTNDAYYVYQYGGYPLEGAFLVWDGVASNPMTYTNAVFGVAYHIETNVVSVTSFTNVSEFADYDYVQVQTYDVYAITDRVYDTSVSVETVYGTNETIYIVNTNYIGGIMFVVTNTVEQTQVVSFDTVIVTNGYTDTVTPLTNWYFNSSIVTNTTRITTVSSITNVFDYAWMDGSVSARQKGLFGQQTLYDSTNLVMKLMYYPCNDAKREEALGEEVP